MTTTIKITELTNIGANLASSTVIPVVNMAGTPTTEKTVLGNIANVVLAGAGGNYVSAAKATTATTANTVLTNAQPNITSTGNLTGLTVSNATGVINFSNTANVTLGNVSNLHIAGGTAGQLLSTNGNGTLSWASDTTTYGNSNVVSLMASFGSNTIITTGNITGGNINISNGYANVTGPANTVGGGATVGVRSILAIDSAFGSNDANDPASAQSIRGRVTGANLTKTRNYVTGVTGQYLVTGTNASEFIKAGILGVVGDQTTTADGAVVAYLDGDGGLTTANAAYAVSMKNSTPNSGFNYGLDLQFINLNVAGTTTTFKQADIRFNNGVTLVANTAGNISINANVTVGNIIATNIGNISNINLTGNASNVLYGNGVFASIPAGANTGNVTFNDINIIGTGNLNLQPDSATGESLDIYLTAADDIHIAGSGNVILGTDEQANVAVLTNGNVAIQAGNVSGTQTWNFGTDGNLTLPRGGVVYETNIPDGGLNGNTIALAPSGGTNTDQQLLIYPTTNDANHLHLTSGNLYSTELFLGDDNLYVKLANTGNIVINSNDDAGNTAQWTFDTTGNLYLPDTTSVIANVSITLSANDTGNSTGLSLIGDAHANLYAHGNVTIVSDSSNTTPTWTFDTTGNLSLPGDLIGPAGANFTIYSNAAAHEFIFGDDGTFYAPDNAVLGGNAIYIGPGANTLNGIEHEVFIASSNLFPYVQAVVNNVSDNGSADWVALGAKGGDAGGQTSLGFTSSGFGDANYTITGNGDGYVLVQSYAPGQTLLGGGGNLILSTGNNGTTKDIIFGTGGFLSSNIFGRISNANNSFELSRAGATIKFPDSTVQNTAWTGNVARISNGNSNVNIATANGNIVITSSGTNGWNFDTTGNLTIPGSSGGFIKTIANASIGIAAVDNGTNNPAQLLSMTNAGAATSIVSAYSTNVAIQTNASGSINTWSFDNTGNLTLPTGGNISTTGNVTANNFIGNGSQLTNVATSTTGNWTLTPGVNTVNLSVPINGTYSIWVRGNIPNGIVTYTATAVVTNNNVPVLGSSYGWYYEAGNALVLTSIPTQFVGTVNNISNAVVVTTTANVFTFGITNNSGNTAVVNYGYTKL